jgi:DNA polymerase III subunit gamma/tau
MSYQVLARKYRPQKFSDVIGQDHVTRTLKNAIEQQRIAHGYIFSGHRGIGKTTIARILAMALNCRSKDHPVPEPCGVCESCTEIRAGNSVDVIEIDAATNRGIDEIRELRDAARYRPARDRYKIWILDEAHQITDAAFNALLKTLEEPPGHVIFMMATTQPEDIPQTIRSRCQHFSFHAVRFEEIVGQLESIAKAEGIEADHNALSLLAEAGDGSMRDALSIMDQAIACCGTRLTAEVVRQLIGSVPSEVLEDLMGAVEQNSSENVLKLVDRLMIEGQNPTYFAKQLVRFLRNAIVAKVAGADTTLLQISRDEAERVGRVAEKFTEEDLTRFLQIMLRTHNELGYKQEQRFHLELGLLRMVHAQRLLPLEQLLSDVPAASATNAPRSIAGNSAQRTSLPPGTSSRPVEPAASRPARPSPFEADLSRKRNEPSSSIATETVSGSSALAMGTLAAATAPVPVAEPLASTELSLPKLQAGILTALEEASHRTPAERLEEGDWKVQGTELVISVPVGEKLLAMVFSPDVRKIINSAAATAAAGPVKVTLQSSGPGNGNGSGNTAKAPISRMGNGLGARARASEDPIVKRMQEKFGAEIRTVIDYRDKK